MSRHEQQQQASYHNDGDEQQQEGFSPATLQIGQVDARFSTSFQEPARRAAKSLPKVKIRRNGSAKDLALKYTDPVAWRAMRAEERSARIAAKRALRNASPAPETDPQEDAEAVTTPRPRREKVKPKEATATNHPLNAREIVAHDKKQAEREEAERTRVEAEAQAERDKHNTRADAMRAAIERREYHIERLEAQLENSILIQQREIDDRRAQLEQQIAAHHAQHAVTHGVTSNEERAAHSLEAEYLRSAVTRHTIRLDFLNADAKPDDSHMQRLIHSEQSKLRLARRALAEHMAHSVQSERLLEEQTHKPKLLLANLETELVRSTGSQEREIAQQRQKLAQTRRELPEYICDAVKQERLLGELQKEVAAQAAKVEEYNKPNLEAEKSDAERELTRLQRQLSAVQDKLSKTPPATDENTFSPTKPLQPKPKATKLDRLWREALDAAKAARDARNNARKAEKSGDPLRAHLDRKATQLKDIAATKAQKYRKEEARVNPPAAKKVAPKLKPRAKLPASAPEQPTPAAPVVKSTVSITEPADKPAERKPDTSANPEAKPARHRITYPRKKPVPPRPITPEVIAMILADPKKPEATTKKGPLKPKAEAPATPPAAAPKAVVAVETHDVAKASSAFPPTAPAKPLLEPAASALPADTNANDLTSQLAAARKAADIAIRKGDPDAVELLRAANALAAQLEQSAPQSAPKPAPAPNTLAQQVLDILNGRNDAPAESGFAAREIAKRQAEAQRVAEAQAAATAAAEKKAAEAAAVALEAQREEVRQRLVARQRAAREAAEADEAAGITHPNVKPTEVDRGNTTRPASAESLQTLTEQLGAGKAIDPMEELAARRYAAREAAARAQGDEAFREWQAQEAERRATLARTTGR
jgi:hypothetical protein